MQVVVVVGNENAKDTSEKCWNDRQNIIALRKIAEGK